VLHTALDRIGKLLVGTRLTVCQSIQGGVQRPFIAIDDETIDLGIKTVLPESVLGSTARLSEALGQVNKPIGLT
jgi:F420-0:gamma-glutamyl ligase